MNPKQLARIGIFYLEEAVLDVLFEAMETSPEDPYVKLVDINEKIGGKWAEDGWSVRILLTKLEAKNRVEQKAKYGPWKLTEAEYQQRC